MNATQRLYQLQETELESARLAQQKKQIESALADDAAVKRYRRILEEVQTALKPLRQRFSELEHQLEANQNKQHATEDRLYSGTIKNPKELQDMQQEVESLKAWRAQLEERMLETMVAVEETEEANKVAQTQFDQAVASAASRNSELHEQLSEIQMRLQANKGQQEKLRDEVPPALLTEYERAKPQKAQRPLSLLNGDTCTVCGVAQVESVVRAVRSGQEVTRCRNCQRILVQVD